MWSYNLTQNDRCWNVMLCVSLVIKFDAVSHYITLFVTFEMIPWNVWVNIQIFLDLWLDHLQVQHFDSKLEWFHLKNINLCLLTNSRLLSSSRKHVVEVFHQETFWKLKHFLFVFFLLFTHYENNIKWL